jgi:hypothetical protein
MREYHLIRPSSVLQITCGSDPYDALYGFPGNTIKPEIVGGPSPPTCRYYTHTDNHRGIYLGVGATEHTPSNHCGLKRTTKNKR